MPYQKMLLPPIDAALRAGKAVLEVYQTDFAVTSKSDRSPLTRADQKSHDLIVSGLGGFGIPILSEEGRNVPFEQRKAWETLWIVDPLDGTKEFVKRNGEFTVNIALVHRGHPVMGVIFVPVTDVLYFAIAGIGAWRFDGGSHWSRRQAEAPAVEPEAKMMALIDQSTRLPVAASGSRPYTIMGSRSHPAPELEGFVAQKRQIHGEIEFIAAGSSLKICQVAEGRADVYPRLGPTMEWDTAAGHAIAECAGARIGAHATGKPLVYNKENLLNPWFVVDRP